jgi:hypothetical protein
MDKKKLKKLEQLKTEGLAKQAGELQSKLHHLELDISILERRLKQANHALASECDTSEKLQQCLNRDPDGMLVQRLEAFVAVQEDWYGNFKLADDARYPDTRFVCVMFLGLTEDAGWRVAVWGNDDCGMEQDFPPSERKKAMQLYIDIVTKRFPTKGWLRFKGLNEA